MSITFLHIIRTLVFQILAPLAHPFRSTLPPNFPLTPSSHRCEGVSGKFGGAPDCAVKTSWARAQVRGRSRYMLENRLPIPPHNWPPNRPDRGAYLGACFRASLRAVSGPSRHLPQSIAGELPGQAGNADPPRPENTVGWEKPRRGCGCLERDSPPRLRQNHGSDCHARGGHLVAPAQQAA